MIMVTDITMVVIMVTHGHTCDVCDNGGQEYLNHKINFEGMNTPFLLKCGWKMPPRIVNVTSQLYSIASQL